MSRFTHSPKKGDIVCFGADKKVEYISLETFDALPSGYTTVGVVAKREGRNVLVIHKESANQKWAEVFLWRLTGYVLDGASHSCTITSNSVTNTVNYTASTEEEFAAQVQEQANTFGTEQYTCYVRNGEVVLQHNTYTSYKAVTASGITVAAWVAPEIIADSHIARYNGARSSEGAIANMDRSLIYFMADLSATTYNPSSNVTNLATTYPVCLPAYLGTSQYQSDHCALLREKYGEGVEGWLRFMEAQRVINPSMQITMQRDGKADTYALAEQTFVKSDGTTPLLYPAATYASRVQYDCEGLRAGNWYLPSLSELVDIIKDVKYPAIYEDGKSKSTTRDADVLNTALQKIGGVAVQNNISAWSSSRYYTNNSWIFYGLSGFCIYYYFCVSNRCIPCVLCKLP